MAGRFFCSSNKYSITNVKTLATSRTWKSRTGMISALQAIGNLALLSSHLAFRFCCSMLPMDVFESRENEMVLMHNGFGEQGRGFKARIWSSLDHPTTEALPLTSPATNMELTNVPSEVTNEIGVPPWLTRPHSKHTTTTVPAPMVVFPTLLQTTPLPESTLGTSSAVPLTIQVGITFTAAPETSVEPPPPLVPFDSRFFFNFNSLFSM